MGDVYASKCERSVCSRTYILKGFQIFYLVGYFVMGSVIFWPSSRPKNAIPRWYTGRKWHIPTASNRKRSRGRIKAYDMGKGEGPILPLQSCTRRELFPLDDD